MIDSYGNPVPRYTPNSALPPELQLLLLQEQEKGQQQANPLDIVGQVLEAWGTQQAGSAALGGLGSTAGTAGTFSATAPTAAADAFVASQGLGAAGTEGAGLLAADGALATVGVPAAVAAGTFLAGKEGYDVLRGKGKSWGDANSGSRLGRVQLGLTTGGLSEIARPFFKHKKTGQYQQERSDALAKTDPTYANFLQTKKDSSADIDALLAKAKGATADDYRGWWDDPDTEQNDWAWVNKLSKGAGTKHNAEGFATLGAGDVIHNPWFHENFEGWGNQSWDVRSQIAEEALRTGNPFGNKGNIDFRPDETVMQNWRNLATGKSPVGNIAPSPRPTGQEASRSPNSVSIAPSPNPLGFSQGAAFKEVDRMAKQGLITGDQHVQYNQRLNDMYGREYHGDFSEVKEPSRGREIANLFGVRQR